MGASVPVYRRSQCCAIFVEIGGLGLARGPSDPVSRSSHHRNDLNSRKTLGNPVSPARFRRFPEQVAYPAAAALARSRVIPCAAAPGPSSHGRPRRRFPDTRSVSDPSLLRPDKRLFPRVVLRARVYKYIRTYRTSGSPNFCPCANVFPVFLVVCIAQITPRTHGPE